MPTLNSVTFNGDNTCGPAIYSIKETLVAEGWTVRGSGDGGSRHGDIDAAVSLPGAQQGSGGAYDCWTSGSTAFSGVAGGAGNTDAWCWLRSPSGDRDVILTSTADGFTDSTGRVGYSRKGAGGFVGGSTNATTFPAVPVGGAGDEFWGVGSRSNDGAIGRNVGASVTRYDVCYADGEFWWRLAYDDNGTGTPDTNVDSGSWAGIFPLAEGTYHPDDPDPVAYGHQRIVLGDPFAYWQHSTSAFVTPTNSDTGQLTNVPASFDGERVLYPLIIDNASTSIKGTIDPTFMLTCAVDQTQGERVTLPDGRVHMVVQFDNRLHFRVPNDTATIPNVTASDLTGYNPVPEPGTVDATAPVVSLVSPADGSKIGKTTEITIDVTDETGLARVWLSAKFAAIGTEEVIWRGSAAGLYDVTETAISGGYRYVIRRRGGWPASPEIIAEPIDTGGNLG